ncbi:polysaccharide deacetylase family protein [Phormidium tenue FACHB-886]|nr:polysaccharide deacetylase family protein [Phormidium tenue FACHB-886]
MTTNSNTLYQPSVIELAQAGNSRAVAYWMNSLLAPQGIQVRVTPTASGQALKILVNFQPPHRRETCLQLRERLVRFICYRLWTLNSEAILGVQIVARIPGEAKVLWQQSVRINTPANAERVRKLQAQRLRQQESSFGFQFVRSLLLSSVTLAGFYLGYRLFYVELSRLFSGKTAPQPMPALAVLPSYQPSVQAQSVSSRSEDRTMEMPRQFQGEVIMQLAPANGEKVVALTFDDGPWGGVTDQVLDILKQYQIKATFFMVGMYLQQYPDLAKRVAAEGHAIGNHTWDHPLHDVSLAAAAQQIDSTQKLIYETTGVQTSLFRPSNEQVEGEQGELVTYAREQKYGTVLWSVDSEDYYVSAPILIDNVLRNVQPGRIVLLHDGGGDRTATVQALPQIISALKQQGYRFVTVPQLMALQTQQSEAAPETAPEQAQPETAPEITADSPPQPPRRIELPFVPQQTQTLGDWQQNPVSQLPIAPFPAGVKVGAGV